MAAQLVGRAAVALNKMSKEPVFSELSDGGPPEPRPGFEADVIREMTELFAALPHGTASLRVGRVPNHPDWREPCFDVIPANPRAARFRGIAVVDDLTLVIGESEREFVAFGRGGTVVRGASWAQEFECIWRAVVAGGFSEHRYLNSSGTVIGWGMRLGINGGELILRNGRRSEHLFGRAMPVKVAYEPYVLG